MGAWTIRRRRMGNNGHRAFLTQDEIAVYSFQQGKVAWDRFIKISPQKVAAGKKVAYGIRKTGPGTVLPYPAGLALIAESGKADRLLVAGNYSDNVVLLDTSDGSILKAFDLSQHPMVPSEYPYTVVATHDGRRAWVSLWNASSVAELDLTGGKVVRWIPLMQPKDPTAPGSHPTALLLSPDEKLLYVALSNVDRVVTLSTSNGRQVAALDTAVAGQKFSGSSPNALALSGVF